MESEGQPQPQPMQFDEGVLIVFVGPDNAQVPFRLFLDTEYPDSVAMSDALEAHTDKIAVKFAKWIKLVRQEHEKALRTARLRAADESFAKQQAADKLAQQNRLGGVGETAEALKASAGLV